MLSRCLAIALSLAVAAQEPPVAPPTGPNAEAPMQRFRNTNGTFEIDLPAGWRLLPPNDAARLSDNPAAPRVLHQSLPHRFYAIGPVEAWQAGDFTGPFLYVVENDDPWYVGDDFAEHLREGWQRQGEATGIRNELSEIRKQELGTQQVECVTALRLSTPPPPAAPLRSLDVHAPCSSRQLSLSFHCPPESFDRWQQEFRRCLATLTFARVVRSQETLTGRLWTPMIAGAVVGIVLLVLYRHTRRRAPAAR